ncbi:VacJ-like lipoprotein precursor [hydrothermal vent metagenome]|uniref:VacJ-like lipoprotein n=1 Tax=hydrothermal vent metagenome TaxID=652676 RepID=A0A1W1CG42_9ZZZZ
MKKILVLFWSIFLFSCSTIDNLVTNDDLDPLEPINRVVFDFNLTADKYVLSPINKGYQSVTPKYVQNRVSDFFGNLSDIKTAFNQFLQFKIVDGFGSIGRVALNSTIGILGLFDVATDLKITKKNEDFGQTLAVWGVGKGPFLMLPFFGPSTLRDATGIVGDSWVKVNPQDQLPVQQDRLGVNIMKVIDARSQLGSMLDVVKRKKDPYIFARDGWLQKREFDIYDGNPPQDDFNDF